MSSASDINKEILEARKKFGELYANIKLGGKGQWALIIFQVPRKERRQFSTRVTRNKIRKLAVQLKNPVINILTIEAKKLNDIQEVNIFKNDNTVIHFKKPAFEYSMKEKVSFVTGAHENKHIKDLLPNIIKQLGPRQFSFMQEYAETLKNTKKDEAPELVEDFEQASEK